MPKKEKKERKYLPTVADLVDRLSICQLKEWFIPEKKSEYAQEIADIEHDISLMFHEDNVKANGEMIRSILVLGMTNFNIWMNEANFRKHGSKDGCNLELTHSLNSIRSTSKNLIQSLVGHGRKDYKIDCLTAAAKNYVPSGWGVENEEKK